MSSSFPSTAHALALAHCCSPARSVASLCSLHVYSLLTIEVRSEMFEKKVVPQLGRQPFQVFNPMGFQHSVAAEFRSLWGPAGCVRARGLFDFGLPPTPCVLRGECQGCVCAVGAHRAPESQLYTGLATRGLAPVFGPAEQHSNSAKPAAGSSLHSSRVALLASHPPTGASLSCSW